MKTIAFFTLIILLSLISCSSRDIATKDKSTIENKSNVEDTIISKLNKNIPQWMNEYHVPCVGIGYVEKGKLKWKKVYGDLKEGQPASENTIFNIASITKPVVSVVTLKLVEAGLWNLDEPLANYWIDPDVANDPRHAKLTSRHVLSHQTGFPNWRTDKKPNVLSFEFEPGTKYQYSGEGFEYLRKALERKLNRTIVELTDSVLFMPLKMNDTHFGWNENIDESRFAFWHTDKGKLYNENYKRGVDAAGSLLTTINDFSKFVEFLMTDKCLSENIFSDMIKPHVYIKEHVAYGLGWNIVENLPNGEYALMHGGSDKGVRVNTILLPKSERAIIIFTNADNGLFVYNNIIKESLDVGAELLNKKHKAGETRTEIILAENVLKKYAGTYEMDNGKQLTLTKDGNSLKVGGESVPNVIFFPESDNEFFLRDFNIQMEISPNSDDGKMTLLITEDGNTVVKAVMVQ